VSNEEIEGFTPQQLSKKIALSTSDEIKTVITKKTAKRAQKSVPAQKLSSYEICVQKATTYLRAKKFDRFENIVKQGMTIFAKSQCQE